MRGGFKGEILFLGQCLVKNQGMIGKIDVILFAFVRVKSQNAKRGLLRWTRRRKKKGENKEEGRPKPPCFEFHRQKQCHRFANGASTNLILAVYCLRET